MGAIEGFCPTQHKAHLDGIAKLPTSYIIASSAGSIRVATPAGILTRPIISIAEPPDPHLAYRVTEVPVVIVIHVTPMTSQGFNATVATDDRVHNFDLRGNSWNSWNAVRFIRPSLPLLTPLEVQNYRWRHVCG